MSKLTIDDLIKKIPNRYLLAITAGKEYRRCLNECTTNEVYITHDKLYPKVIDELSGRDFTSLDYLTSKERI